MVINNIVELIGNIGFKVKIIEIEIFMFVSFFIVIMDSYQDKEIEEWKEREIIWYDVVVFNFKFIEVFKVFDKGVRLKIIGILIYCFFLV